MRARGFKHTKETRKKISESHTGMKKPWSKFLGESQPITAETKKKISKTLMGHSVSIETRQKISNKLSGIPRPYRVGMPLYKNRGENNSNWKGGITSLNERIRKSLEYKLWRAKVFARDNWTCVWCKARTVKGEKVILNADHIKPFAFFPTLRFAVGNGRTLCVPCHKKTDTYGQNKI